MMFGYILSREKKNILPTLPRKTPCLHKNSYHLQQRKRIFPMGYPGVGRDFDQKYEMFFQKTGKECLTMLEKDQRDKDQELFCNRIIYDKAEIWSRLGKDWVLIIRYLFVLLGSDTVCCPVSGHFSLTLQQVSFYSSKSSEIWP